MAVQIVNAKSQARQTAVIPEVNIAYRSSKEKESPTPTSRTSKARARAHLTASDVQWQG